MVMTQSLFKVLKQQDPAATIEVLAPAWSLGLLERMPEVAQAWVSPFGHGELNLRERYRLGKQLAARQFDQVIFIPNSFKSILAPLWARIPQRTGWHGEWPRRLLLNDSRKLDKQRWPLMVERFAALGLPADGALPNPLPKPRFVIDPAKLAAALQKYELQPPQQPLLVIAPGAEFGPSKRWPPRYFAAVAREKIREGWEVWLFGSSNDRAAAAEVNHLTAQACRDLTGKTTLAEAVDLLSLATIVVSNDSGMMHIAAALQRPIVAVYGPTPADVTPPLAEQVESLFLDLPCRPCMQRECPLGHWRCMEDLQPAAVLASVARLSPKVYA
jgi:heptosyltransferase II